MPQYGNKKCPGPEGVAWFLRCPLTGHIGPKGRSKNHDKGGYGIQAPVLGTKAAVDTVQRIIPQGGNGSHRRCVVWKKFPETSLFFTGNSIKYFRTLLTRQFLSYKLKL
jgi:hypothetical protein